GAEPARRELETRTRARRRLEKEVHDRTPGQQRRQRTVATGFAQCDGAIEQRHDVRTAEAVQGQEMARSIAAGTRLGHGSHASLEANQFSRMTSAAIASIVAACLRFAVPEARCSAKRRAASFDVRRSSTRRTSIP